MNNKGSTLFFTLMLGLTVLILALALAPSVMQFTNTAMSSTTGLDCNNESISNFDKATCIATDLNAFYFIGGLIFLVGVIITARIRYG